MAVRSCWNCEGNFLEVRIMKVSIPSYFLLSTSVEEEDNLLGEEEPGTRERTGSTNLPKRLIFQNMMIRMTIDAATGVNTVSP